MQFFYEELPGFGLRKYATGESVCFCRYNVGKQQHRLRLAKVVRGNLKDMRALASVVFSKAKLGIDVVGDKRAAEAERIAAETNATTTLGALVFKYLEALKASCASHD